MVNSIEYRVKEILKRNINNPDEFEARASNNGLLSNLGINSLTYIKIVVEIESQFGFEFEDEDLNYEKFKTINDIVCYVESNLG